MKTIRLKEFFAQHPSRLLIQEHLNKKERFKIHLKGLAGSSLSLLAASFSKTTSPHVFIFNEKEEAAYFYNDMATILDEKEVLFFPSSYKRSVQYEKTDSFNIILRTEVLNQLCSSRQPLFVISYPEALIEKVAERDSWRENTLSIHPGEKLSREFMVETLISYGFERVDFVIEPGQFSVRGSIIDIFSFSDAYPCRIDFFGEEVESIRLFNVENQLSKKELKYVKIIPNMQDNLIEKSPISFLEFIPADSVIWCKNIAFVNDRINSIYNSIRGKAEQIKHDAEKTVNEKYLIQGQEMMNQLGNYTLVEFGQRFFFPPQQEIRFNQNPQPAFNKNFELLGQYLINNQDKNIQNYILSNNPKQIDRIQTIFEDKGIPAEFFPINQTLHEGFLDQDLNICCFTDHQIFDRYHKFQLKNAKFKKAKESITLKEISRLHPGDYVVHDDYGIGRFGGLQKVEINNKHQEVIRLVYKDNDILLVSLHSLHKISKYKGKDSIPPKIYKLGTGAWQKLKERTKSKIKDIAKELILLYAKRKSETGFSFSPDSYLQQELEASFIYEDTPDQIKATEAVKEGMESSSPMDCLVCGDVGFGKTEVAIRAAFKAVADSKQVIVLVPTTILALQHFKTFSDRFKNFPCRIEYISRLKKTKEQKEILRDLKDGKVDIIIGTHRIVGKDVVFKDLGLLIIDEEQKFGVSVKEKLKQLKVNVDTLTLTATPIPRTLKFSLMGARDLFIINTPPPNRYPIATELHTFNEDIIREAIEYEINRNGQVFFIHNRIQNILEIEARINHIVPGINTVAIHGQMKGPVLEKIMLDFICGDYDVLIATSIIESGLDIPNANTIIVNNAQNFGLSDLHQLRGRVGRSNKKAFCYLLAPPLEALTQEARRRLKAIEDFSELGSGFNIAMQDLDIRGSGNLLGSEQSGFITDMGFETYHRILDDAILELKETEFKSLFTEEKGQAKKTPEHFINDCQIDTDMEILFPDEYIESTSERIRLYRELDHIETEEKIQEFENQLTDRFGAPPKPTIELLNVVRLRRLAIGLGIEKIVLKNSMMAAYFISNQNSLFFQSPQFSNVLVFVQQQKIPCKLEEVKNKLCLSFKQVKDIKTASETLTAIKEL